MANISLTVLLKHSEYMLLFVLRALILVYTTLYSIVNSWLLKQIGICYGLGYHYHRPAPLSMETINRAEGQNIITFKQGVQGRLVHQVNTHS